MEVGAGAAGRVSRTPSPASTEYVLVIYGAPRTKKTSQQIAVNKATGATFIVQNKLLQQWTKSARLQLASQWGARPALRGDVEVTALIYRDRAVGDMLNYAQAIADVLQAHRKRIKGRMVTLWHGVIDDDRQVVSWDGSRMFKDAERPRVELTVRVLG